MTENIEKSAGCIIYKLSEAGNPLFLVVRDIDHGNWGFPKGRIDSGETEQEAARRECKEEVGLNVNLKEGFKESIKYYADSARKDKVTTYFLAEAVGGDKVDYSISNEINDHKWLPMYEAIGRVTFVNAALLVEKARNFIYDKKQNNTAV